MTVSRRASASTESWTTLPESTAQRSSAGSSSVDTARLSFSSLQWTIVGTRDGHFRSFPGAAEERGLENGEDLWNQCRRYDPRIRPWFIGASTGPKDIVLVVDKSASMSNRIGDENRTKWDLVLDAVGDIIDTFTFADYVAIVTFSNEASTVPKGSDLLRGRAENLSLLKEALLEEAPSGETKNFTAAFEKAFSLLWEGCDNEPAQCSNCEKIILFLTDGSSGEDGESIKPSEMATTIQELQEKLSKETDRRALIFTYSMSDEADDLIPRQIACSNGGAWAFIGPETNTLDALNSYYLFVAAGRPTEVPFWIEPYEDAGGMGLITTVAVPFYARGTRDVPDVFLGVVGHDVPLWELEFEGVTQDKVFAAIFNRAQRCTLTDAITPCALQVFRNAYDRRALCPDPIPILSNASSPKAKSQESDIQCHAFRDKYYWRSVAEVKWRKAASRCEDRGGQLADVEDKEELAFLANLASNDGTWIGAKRSKTRGFAWRNKSRSKLPKDSEYWGVQEPVSVLGTENCVAIDSRGVTANLKAMPCNRRATYICKFETDSPCPAGVADAAKRGFLNVPPLSKCVDEIEALDETRPVKDVKQLTVEDVMCDLGEERTSEELLCCDDNVEKEVSCKKGRRSSSEKKC